MKYLHQLLYLAPDPFIGTSADLSDNDNESPRPSWAKQERVGRSTGSLLHYQQFPIFILLLLSISLLCWVLPVSNANARHNSQHPLTTEEWQEVMAKVTLLDSAVLIPSLLPVIMTNRDALELSEEQFERFHRWRKENYVNMVNIMNEVIEKRVQFRIESLSPEISDAHLVAFQEEIHRLERELLKIRLTCRAIVMETFTKEQWQTFEFLVADEPRLGSLVSQRNAINLSHGH